jgi:hypothetical protein
MTQHAAAMAANLAAQIDRWSEFRALLRPHATGPENEIKSLALGWQEQYRTGDPSR